MQQPEVHPAVRFRTAMDCGCVAAPGAFNALSAMAIRGAGFTAAYVSGGATSAASGVPDIGLIDRGDVVTRIREVASASGLPVLADADTGFGEEEAAHRTVIEYNAAGAAGLHLEDQVFPKRCGHLDGKTLIPVDHMAEKIRWARIASEDATDGSFIVCARTDARAVEGLSGAIDRARAYVDAGADMIFPEGLADEDEFGAFAKALDELGDRRPYLLANMTEFGKTQPISLDRFGDLGYSVVIYPVTLLRAAMGAIVRTLDELQRTGGVDQATQQMQTRQELYDMLGYRPGSPWCRAR